MALGKRLINTGAAAAVCNTESVQAFGEDSAFSSNIALYQLDGDGGVTNNVPDTTTNYNGTASNVTYTTGQFGNAAVFNGSSSFIELPTIDLTTFGDYTISLWAKGSSLASTNISLLTSFVINKAEILMSAGDINFLGNTNTLVVDYPFNSSNWYHLVLVNSGTNTFGYINGVSQSGTTSTSGIKYLGNARIGRRSFTGLGDYYFNGSIDQVRIFDRAITPEEVSTLYNETTSTASNTNPLSDGSGVALYSLDYDASDTGGLYDGTPTDVDFGVDGQINYGARFNGSSSYIDAGNINLGTNNVSVSLWVHPNSSQVAYANIIDYNHSSAGGWTIQQDNTSTNSYKVTVYDGSTYNVSSAFSLTANQWSNVVFTVTSAGVYNIYVNNGTPTTGTGLIGLSASTNNTLNIGRWIGGTSRYWGGSIDQVRIFSKALNQTEVDTLFAEEACVHTSTTDIVNYPTGTTPVAYYKLDNSSEDETGNYDGTDTNIEYRFGRFGQAAVFNGSSSYVSIADGSFRYSSITISAWVNPDSTSSNHLIFSNYDFISVSKGIGFRIASGKLEFVMYKSDLSGQRSETISNESISTGQWTHVLATFTGSTAKLYINGSEATYSTQTTGAVATYHTNCEVRIGALAFGGGNEQQYFDGKIDQVRIYDVALTSSQVTELYNEKPEVDTSNFKTVLYEGDSNTSGNYISNVGFQPDLVWIKFRNTAVRHLITDSVNGASVYQGTGVTLHSNETFVSTNYGEFTSFDANGFTVRFWSGSQYFNTSGLDYVAWVWKGGGDAVTLTNTGNVDSDVSVNNESGFSIVKASYGNGDYTKTVKHGLTNPPEIIICKILTTGTWFVFEDASGNLMGSDNHLHLDTTDASALDSSFSIQSSDTFKTGYSTTAYNIIAYCFHSVSGYSKIGSYEGNSSTKKITLDFAPSWVMIKLYDVAGGNWFIYDNKRNPTNPADLQLEADTANLDTDHGTGYELDFLSDGFELQGAGGAVNFTGRNYIYMAFK